MGDKEGEMSAEKIATTRVVNGPTTDDTWVNELRVAWAAVGSAPDAPDGWVNHGYAQLSIGKVDEGGHHVDSLATRYAVQLDDDEMDHLIRVLKRVRRQAFRTAA